MVYNRAYITNYTKLEDLTYSNNTNFDSTTTRIQKTYYHSYIYIILFLSNMSELKKIQLYRTSVRLERVYIRYLRRMLFPIGKMWASDGVTYTV